MKIICVGRNYAEHIRELDHSRPEEPVLFLKPDTARLLSRRFYIPEFSQEVHHEVELLVKIKKVGKYIAPEFAPTYYDEIGLGIDFTARDVQRRLKEAGLPWEKAKAFDGAAVIGKKWFPKTDFPDLENLNFSLTKNGETVQKGNTSFMLWSVNQLIAEVSKYFTLKIGDLLFTGTPAGVGAVHIGDRLEGFIEEQSVFQIEVR